jgi:hypothetical protein
LGIRVKNIIQNPWIIGVETIILAQIILLIFNVNLIKEAIGFFISMIGEIGKFFVSNVSLPVWAFILCILAIPIIVILIALLTPKKKETRPSPHDYTKDTFDGIVWRWKYEYNEI